jgi:hypothetical protein
MNFFSVFTNAEADVKAFIQKVVREGEALISEVEAGLSHVASLLPTVTTDVQAATSFVEGLGAISGHPEVVAAAEALNVAVQGVNLFAQGFAQATAPGSSITSSQGTQAIMAGYQGLQATKSAVTNLVAVATRVAKDAHAARTKAPSAGA